MLKCEICDKEEVENGYCKSHSKAYGNIMKAYSEWSKALEIAWKEYLSRIAENPLTGEWAKEVAQHLTRNEE